MAPSRSIARQLARIGVERVVVQTLGVDGDTFHPLRRDEDLRSKLGLAADVRLLVFAGRMAREKQIPLLIDTLGRLGNGYHLLLVGGEARASLAANVTVLPYEQDCTRLARLLASADALVHAGLHETFGLIVIEAMACGRPVIGMRSGAMTELIGDDVGVLAAHCDAASLGRAIESLYDRDWQQLGRNARARVEARYAWSSVFALQTERYQRLARRQTMDDYIPADATGLP
jgi:alpha-1,6-mannosyltransferase